MREQEFVVYIVEPEDSIRDALGILLETYGVQSETFGNIDSFLERLDLEISPHCCFILESGLTGLNGVSLLRTLRKRGVTASVILLTNRRDPSLERQVKKLAPCVIITKPLINSELLAQLANLVPELTPILQRGKS